VSLYSGKIIIPQQVYDELSNPYTPQLKTRVDALISKSDAEIQSILTETSEFNLYKKMTITPGDGYNIIGKGEAAAIALAATTDGTVASNNLKDVSSYVSEFRLRLITTGGILIKALDNSLITEEDGNDIWREMLNKRRKIGSASFTDYLQANAE